MLALSLFHPPTDITSPPPPRVLSCPPPQILVEGPDSNVTRQVIPLKRVYLTDLKVKIPRNARAKTLKKAWATDKIVARWEQTTWCKKLEAKAKRAALTDFDRFKLMVARKEKAAIIKKHMK